MVSIHAKLVPMCTDVVISLSDKTVNLPLGCAGCPHPGVHHKQMGGNWNRCMQMLRRSRMDSSHGTNELIEGLFVFKVIRQKFVFIFLIIQQLM